MEQEEYVGKSCEECRYFKQHYAIADTEFYKTNYGHCSSDLRKMSNRKTRYMDRQNTACKQFQPVRPVILERQEILKDTLFELSQRLNEIAVIMEHDKYFKNI